MDFPPPRTKFGDAIVLSGWVAFESGPTARVEAWLGEALLGRARLGLPRPDVSAIDPRPDAAVSGFELRAGLNRAAADEDEEDLLRVIATSVGGERHEFDPIPVTLSEAPRVEPVPESSTQGRKIPDGRRILAFTNVLTLGGASIYFLELLRETQRQGRVEPTVVTAVDGPLRGELEELGIPVHILSSVPLHDLAAYLDRVEELVAWASDGSFELVLVNTATGLTLPGADLAARFGIPAVWTIHESFHSALLWDGLGPGLREHGEAALSNAALGIFEAEATRQLYLGSLGERSVTVPYGFDLWSIDRVRDSFDRDQARREAEIPADADLIICVGTVEPRKAQVPLVQAFDLIAERHHSAHLAFVGSDQNWGSTTLAGRIESSPSRERMRMVPTTREVQPWFGMADLLVCASDIESLPRTVLEAMAWETPVLATSVFGLPELIDHGVTGWLCEPGDISALAEGIDAALNANDHTRRSIGAAARRKVIERHDLGAYARQLADLLDLAAEGKDVSSALHRRSGGAACAPGNPPG